MDIKFNIGDTIWLATLERETVREPCPDCAGAKRLTVILGDGTEIGIDCPECDHGGYRGSTGYVETYVYQPHVEQVVIDGLDVRPGRVEYRFGSTSCSWQTVDEKRAFVTREGASVAARALAQLRAEQDREALQQKEKPTRKWAWNASCHRQEVRRLEKTLAYHRAKLEIAAGRAKSEKKKGD